VSGVPGASGVAERAEARIDLGAVERNCRTLKQRLEGGADLCAVVKADGYGHGAAGCARAALRGGATVLAVATAREAADLRETLPEARLFVMGALSAPELYLALQSGAEVSIWRREHLLPVEASARASGRQARVHVKHDSGMGRLGSADPGEVRELARAVAASADLELAGLWTHFATADEPASEHFGVQLERFSGLAASLREEHPGLLLHAANSAAALREPGSHFGLVRCGVAIYGLDPFGEDAEAHELEPALSLHSYVADVKRFAPGDSAGYGRTWRADRETLVGVLPIGYGDGVRRSLSNRGEVLLAGRRHPIIGTVSMDNITVDLGPDSEVRTGDPAVLIGKQGEERISAEEWAHLLGTINYEVTCGISGRVPRVAV
jgi:alanine racemase